MSECADLLKGGVFDLITTDKRAIMVSNYQKWVKNLSEEEAKSLTTAGMKISLGDVTLSGNFSREDWQKLKRQTETTLDESRVQADMIQTISLIANKDIIDGFVECMNLTSQQSSAEYGLLVDMTHPDSDLVEISIRWNPTRGGGNAKILNISLANLKKPEDSDISDITEIKENGGVKILYKIVNIYKAAVFVINTDKASASKIIPAQRAKKNVVFSYILKNMDGTQQHAKNSFKFEINFKINRVQLGALNYIFEREPTQRDITLSISPSDEIIAEYTASADAGEGPGDEPNIRINFTMERLTPLPTTSAFSMHTVSATHDDSLSRTLVGFSPYFERFHGFQLLE